MSYMHAVVGILTFESVDKKRKLLCHDFILQEQSTVYSTLVNSSHVYHWIIHSIVSVEQ